MSFSSKRPFIQVFFLQILCPVVKNVLLDGGSLRLKRNVTISLILPYLRFLLLFVLFWTSRFSDNFRNIIGISECFHIFDD